MIWILSDKIKNVKSSSVSRNNESAQVGISAYDGPVIDDKTHLKTKKCELPLLF